MKFDMTKTPPTQEEIDQERDALEKKIKGLRIISITLTLLTGASLLVFAVLFWPKEALNTKDATLIIFNAVAIGLSLQLAIAVLRKINHRMTNYRSTLALLLPLPDFSEECLDLVAACSANAQCDAYRQAVIQQGRAIVTGEARAMIRWPEAARVRGMEAEAHRQRQEACAILHSIEKLA